MIPTNLDSRVRSVPSTWTKEDLLQEPRHLRVVAALPHHDELFAGSTDTPPTVYFTRYSVKLASQASDQIKVDRFLLKKVE